MSRKRSNVTVEKTFKAYYKRGGTFKKKQNLKWLGGFRSRKAKKNETMNSHSPWSHSGQRILD